MSELLSEFMTPGVKTILVIIVIVLVLLYLVSIVWTVRDARLRGSNYIIWGVVSVIPYIGAFVYMLLRQPLYAVDREEQEYDVRMKQRTLARAVDCPNCNYPADQDFLVCPKCGTQLKNQCPYCGHALNPDWIACPYCGQRQPSAGSGYAHGGEEGLARTSIRRRPQA